MPVTPITMQRYPARSPDGTALAPAARHDADRGGADRAGGTRRMAHAVGRPEGPEDTASGPWRTCTARRTCFAHRLRFAFGPPAGRRWTIEPCSSFRPPLPAAPPGARRI